MTPEKSVILYIDDDLFSLELFSSNFADDYTILTLSSTDNAIEVLNSNPVKLIVSDHRMPNETGIEFFKRITPFYPDISKIILTANSSSENAMQAINDAGIHKYLVKPCNRQQMKESMDAAIREFDLRNDKRNLLIELQKKNEEIAHAYGKLEISERKFRAIFAQSSDCSFILNRFHSIIEANDAFLDFIGFHERDLDELNRYVRDKYNFLIENAIDESKKTVVGPVRETTVKTDEIKIIQIKSSVIKCNGEFFILATILDITEMRQFEKKIMEAIIQTQEEEQSRYARELHDGLGPLLSTLKMHIQWISNPLHTTNKNEITTHAIQTIDAAINSVREIANNLSPHILQRFGLVNAVKAYIDRIKNSSLPEFSIFSEMKERLHINTELVLYRTVLECINNSLKHASANKIIVRFGHQSNSLHIMISDDGKGFDVNNEMRNGKGMGLFNMQNRIRSIGGSFMIASAPGSGTHVSIHVN